MSCAFSRDLLALHVEGDLAPANAAATAEHLDGCAECRRFVTELRATQALVRSLRREPIEHAECAGMRRAVMTIIEDGRQRVNWWLRLERALFSHPSYALAVAAIVSFVSVSVYAQIRFAPTSSMASAAFIDERNALARPDGYSSWVVAGTAGSGQHEGGKVFINPSAYREYAATGRFPQGTMMILERTGAADDASTDRNSNAPQLLVSVKDAGRFDDGWGFFDFTARAVNADEKAQPDASCGTCHRRDAENDHVFTQSYPALRAARLSTHT